MDEIAFRTSSLSMVLGIRAGLAADRPFHQTGSSFYFSFYCYVPFEFNSLDNFKNHSL